MEVNEENDLLPSGKSREKVMKKEKFAAIESWILIQNLHLLMFGILRKSEPGGVFLVL